MKNNKVKEIKKDESKEDETDNNWLPIGMCLGISIGLAIGTASNNLGLWLPIGLCLGVSLGVAFSSKKDKNDKEK